MLSLDDVFDVELRLVASKDEEVKKVEPPLVDKYRPRKLSGIVHQDEVVKILQKTLETGNLPHMLFYGPPGTGKTSTILAFARELFGPKKLHDRVIELNASDERGINVVRDKIIRFAASTLSNADPDYPSPPYKIIILDEADAMTTEAQSALRKIMENYSRITRFFFSCNYIDQMISPIVSRCSKFRFKPILPSRMVGRLTTVCHREGIPLDDEAVDRLAEISKGDMRKAIMMLQNLGYVYRKKGEVSAIDVDQIANRVPDKLVQHLCKQLISKHDSLPELMQLSKQTHRLGFPAQNLFERLMETVAPDDHLNDHQKGLIGLKIAMTEKRLLDGADEYLQILSVFTFIKGVFLERITTLSVKL